MSKIDLAIKLTSAGSREPVTTSNGPWVSYIRDVRDVFPYLNGYDGRVITLLSFCKTGSLVTLVRSIPGRAGDNVAAWMHIPSNCAVSGDELSRLMTELKGVLHNSSISMADLQAIAAREYPDKPVSLDYIPSILDGTYAFRKTDFYSLADILGSGRYQEYYTQFKGIFILDANDTITPNPDKGMKDLTRTNIDLVSVLIPPASAEVESAFGPETSLLYQTSTGFIPFNEPIKIKKGSSITLHAYKKGYDKIPFLITLNKDFQKCEFPAGFNPVWKRSFTRNNFKILDSSNGNNPIRSARISVNGVELSTGVLSLTENEIKTARLTVTANGYEPYEGEMRIYNFDSIVIYLTRIVFENQYRVMSKDGRTALDITLPPGKVDKSKSPLEGYVWGHGGGNDTLYFDEKAERKTFWLGVACGIGAALIAALLAWGIPMLFGDKADGNSESKEPTQVEGTDNPIQDNSNAFLGYLDRNEKWVRDSLERYVTGLFDAMNNYDHEMVNSKLGPFRGKSARVDSVLTAIAKDPSKQGNFNTPGSVGENVITIKNYVRAFTPSVSTGNNNQSVGSRGSNHNNNSNSNHGNSNHSNSHSNNNNNNNNNKGNTNTQNGGNTNANDKNNNT